jgi:hypothetical protein
MYLHWLGIDFFDTADEVVAYYDHGVRANSGYRFGWICRVRKGGLLDKHNLSHSYNLVCISLICSDLVRFS